MRTVIVDQFEFENPNTEECLEVMTARRSDSPFPDLDSFARALGIMGTLPGAHSLSELSGRSEIIDYLKRYASIELPEPCCWTCYEMPSGYDDRHVLIETDDGFISYKWSTSA